MSGVETRSTDISFLRQSLSSEYAYLKFLHLKKLRDSLFLRPLGRLGNQPCPEQFRPVCGLFPKMIPMLIQAFPHPKILGISWAQLIDPIHRCRTNQLKPCPHHPGTCKKQLARTANLEDTDCTSALLWQICHLRLPQTFHNSCQKHAQLKTDQTSDRSQSAASTLRAFQGYVGLHKHHGIGRTNAVPFEQMLMKPPLFDVQIRGLMTRA